MSSSWGRCLKISIFGESHGGSIGVVLDGLPSGAPLDMERILRFMARRAPGGAKFSTARKEADLPKIQSGFLNGHTTGTPLCAMIKNTDTRSGDYHAMESVARPSHADYTGFVRYGGYNDVRGGGHFSGRLTAPLVFAGAVAKEILMCSGIFIGGHIAEIHGVNDDAPDLAAISAGILAAVAEKTFPVLNDSQGEKMQAEIETARLSLDSVGGIVAVYALGVPAGIGSPMFGGLENILASLFFAIPGVKGVEFGSGFDCAGMLGSEHNDALFMKGTDIRAETNNHGGILGGISSGMPVTARVALKPTPSIARPQRTVDYRKKEDTVIEIQGRHDPCIVPRALPCAESCMALGILDCMMERGKIV